MVTNLAGSQAQDGTQLARLCRRSPQQSPLTSWLLPCTKHFSQALCFYPFFQHHHPLPQLGKLRHRDEGTGLKPLRSEGGLEHRLWAASLVDSPPPDALELPRAAWTVSRTLLLSPAHCYAHHLKIYFLSCLASSTPPLLHGSGGSQIPPWLLTCATSNCDIADC